MSETNWAPEPWYAIGPLTEEESGRAGGTPAEVGIECEDGPVVIGEFFNERDRDRAVACVNACAGIPDPAAEIERLRRVEVAAKNVLNCWHRYDPNAPPDAFSNRLDELLAAIKERSQ